MALCVSVTEEIRRPVEEVRAQFADMAYHERSRPHSGVTFRVLEETAKGCRFEQSSRSGPFTLSQEIVLTWPETGVIEQRIVRGPMLGSTVRFSFEATAAGTAVTVEICVDARGPMRWMLARQLRRSIRVALEEDRRDLESGAFAAAAAAA